MKKIAAAVAVIILIVVVLGYTKTGTHLLSSLGLTTACDGGCS